MAHCGLQLRLALLRLRRNARAHGLVGVAVSQLPRPEGRSLFTTPAQGPEFWEQAGLSRKSDIQPATLARGRQDPLRDDSSVPDTGRWGWKVRMVKGKAPKVLIASAGKERMADISGMSRKDHVTSPVREVL
jgi:hypothetical protein